MARELLRDGLLMLLPGVSSPAEVLQDFMKLISPCSGAFRTRYSHSFAFEGARQDSCLFLQCWSDICILQIWRLGEETHNWRVSPHCVSWHEADEQGHTCAMWEANHGKLLSYPTSLFQSAINTDNSVVFHIMPWSLLGSLSCAKTVSLFLRYTPFLPLAPIVNSY